MSKEYTRRLSIFGLSPEYGEIYLYDNMEGAEMWTGEGTGTDFFAEFSDARPHHGTRSLHIKSRTTGAAEDDYARVYRHCFLPPSKKLGQISTFILGDITKLKSFALAFTYYDGINDTHAVLTYLVALHKWQYKNSLGGETDVPGADIALIDYRPHRASIATDFNRNEYISFTIDDELFPLTNLPLYSIPNGFDRHLNLLYQITTSGANPAEVYINSVLLHET